MSNPANFKSLRYQLGSEFDVFGGHFIPINGDGNCFFRAVSVSMTACPDLPYGTMAFHNELRQLACDFIENESRSLFSPFSKHLKKKGLVG